MENKKILVAMPVINLWSRYTENALRSIKCKYDWHVLLVDNASTDITKDINTGSQLEALDMDGDRISVIHNQDNKGCGGAWNQCLEFAREHGFTHVLIANNDVIFAPNAIEALADRLDDENVLLVSSVDVSGEVPVAESILDPEHDVNKKEASEAPHPNFSSFMVRASFVDDVGWIDEGFYPAYFEDNDIHRRVKLAKGESAAIATTTSIFYHFGSRTQNESGDAPVVSGPIFEQNRQYFVTKWGGEPGHELWEHPFNDEKNDYKYATRK